MFTITLVCDTVELRKW